MTNGDWRNDRDWRGRQDWRHDTNQSHGSRADERDRWREQGRDDRGRSGEYAGPRGDWGGGRRDFGSSDRDYGRGSGQDFGRDARGGDYDRDFGRDTRAGGSQGDFSGNDYSRGNYGADQGYRQNYGHRFGDYGQQGRGERGFWDRASDEVSSWFGDDDDERRRRVDEQQGGQHRGRGPKGYTRSDERIREDVNDRLSDDSFVDASEIEVSVSSCEVTLSGTVDGRGQAARGGHRGARLGCPARAEQSAGSAAIGRHGGFRCSDGGCGWLGIVAPDDRHERLGPAGNGPWRC